MSMTARHATQMYHHDVALTQLSLMLVMLALTSIVY